MHYGCENIYLYGIKCSFIIESAAFLYVFVEEAFHHVCDVFISRPHDRNTKPKRLATADKSRFSTDSDERRLYSQAAFGCLGVN